jgi:hypothetical protein
VKRRLHLGSRDGDSVSQVSHSHSDGHGHNKPLAEGEWEEEERDIGIDFSEYDGSRQNVLDPVAGPGTEGIEGEGGVKVSLDGVNVSLDGTEQEGQGVEAVDGGREGRDSLGLRPTLTGRSSLRPDGPGMRLQRRLTREEESHERDRLLNAALLG